MTKTFPLSKVTLTFFLIALVFGCSKDRDPNPDIISCIELPEISPKVNDKVAFTSCSQFATSYLWDFGDGNTSTLENPEHIYTTAGDYTIKLTVVNEKNSTHTSTATLTIIASEATGTGCQTHRNNISSDQTWKKGCHIVEGQLTITNGAVLTIEPGAVIKFKNHEYITVGHSQAGTIIAEGTEAEPILFTSFADTPAPGDWDGISIGGSTGTPVVFKHCIFEFGGLDFFEDPTAMVRVYDGGRVTIDNCEFRNSYGYAAAADYQGGFELFTNNYIHDVNDFAIRITGNYAGTIGRGNIIENKGVLIDIEKVTMNATWRGLTCPYVTASNLWVGSELGNTLTLGPGVKIAFQNSQMLLPSSSTSKATLITNGTAENPVILTAFDPDAATRWGGIRLGAQFTADTYFRHTIIEKAQDGSETTGVIYVGPTTLNMENCSISGDKQYGINMSADAKLGVFSNNDFGKTNEYSIKMRLQNLQKIGDGNTFSGNNNVRVMFSSVTEDVVWPALDVYYDAGILYLGSPDGNTVTFEPGSKFLISGAIRVGQGYNTVDPMPVTFNAVGTPENPIIITGSLDDTPSRNELINFTGSSFSPDSKVEYCHLSRGWMGIRVINVYNDPANPYPIIRNNTISDCSSYAIYVANSTPLIENNTYSNNGLDGVYYME